MNNGYTDYVNFNYDTLIFQNPLNNKITKNTKIKIYEQKGECVQKIKIKTPKLHFPFNLSSSNYDNITFELAPLVGDIKKLYDFIKKINKKIKENCDKIITQKDGKIKYFSCISKSKLDNLGYLMMLKIPYDKTTKKHQLFMFDDKKNKYDYNNEEHREFFKYGGTGKAIFELVDIYINYDELKVSINWEIKQMIYYPKQEYNEFMFSDDEEEESCGKPKFTFTPKPFFDSTSSIPPPPMNIPKPPVVKTQQPKKSSAPTIMRITPDMLLNVQLRKTVQNPASTGTKINKNQFTKDLKSKKKEIIGKDDKKESKKKKKRRKKKKEQESIKD